MANWLTTHYPHAIPDDVEWDVFEHGRSKHFVAIKPGDNIAFFVYASGPKLRDGRERSKGRPGICKIGLATSGLIEEPYEEHLTRGRTLRFRRRVSCTKHRNGFLSQQKLNEILKYQSNARRYPTLRSLSPVEFDSIKDGFKETEGNS